MHLRLLALGLGLCLPGLAGGPSSAAEPAAASSQDGAIVACAAAGDLASAQAVVSVGDGRGGSLVWLTDEAANLWLCNADGEGRVYALSMIFEDLLKGAGAALIAPIYLDRDGKPKPPLTDPLAVVAGACRAYLGGEGAMVVGSGKDGLNDNWLPGYFVFLESAAGETFFCDATPNAQVWAFARIGTPLGLEPSVG